MRISEIKSCYIGPEISPEQFIAEHFFLYITKGSMHGYDGHRSSTLSSGKYCLVRKNHLARYNKERADGGFEKVVIILDEAFLKKIKGNYIIHASAVKPEYAFIPLRPNERIFRFLDSLIPHYNGFGKIAPEIADDKRRELLELLLTLKPDLAAVLFDFGKPEKIDLEAFMNRNYKFNASIERFAYLTGRSRSAFKRDFQQLFHETPNRWLTRKRLKEAYFLITKKQQKPTAIYLDLGFENLSHFSYAFKKAFGQTASQLLEAHS
jgi:AraC family transcriptional regulator, exoenzyme S synthesis regulatory protein ExsA